MAELSSEPDEILILSPHCTKAKTSLADHSRIGEWPLVGLDRRKPGELSILSINKAKGLDALAAIMGCSTVPGELAMNSSLRLLEYEDDDEHEDDFSASE